MLNEEQYEALWNHSPNGMGSFATKTGIAAPPPYDEYIIRENMFQDYLDIFRGVNTRGNIAIRPHEPAIWYYPHPFFIVDEATNLRNIPQLIDRPCIKYILIAEAPPKVKNEDLNLEDNERIKYIYNSHLRGGSYITAPLNAFGTIGANQMPQTQRLLALATNGVLVLDLYPFAIKYTSQIRNSLTKNNILANFYCDQINLYSVYNRLNTILNEIQYHKILKGCFIAPPNTSNAIANHIIANNLQNFNFNINNNLQIIIFDTRHNDIGNFEYRAINNTLIISVKLNNIYEIGGLKEIPQYRCCCYSGSKTVPHEIFIKNALGLDPD